MLFLFFVSLFYFVVVSGKRCEILLQNVRLYSLWLPLWKSCNTFISFSQKQLHMYSYIVLRLQKNVTFEVCIEGQRQICCFGVGKKRKTIFCIRSDICFYYTDTENCLGHLQRVFLQSLLCKLKVEITDMTSFNFCLLKLITAEKFIEHILLDVFFLVVCCRNEFTTLWNVWWKLGVFCFTLYTIFMLSMLPVFCHVCKLVSIFCLLI